MLQKAKPSAGILIKFVEPKNNRNATIQVTWSPRFCLLQRRINIHNINETAIAIYDRLVTFEGPEHLSVLESITSPTLASDIQKLCKNIAGHIKKITNNKMEITKMCLHFKIDPWERIWLLYTTGLQVNERNLDSIKPLFCFSKEPLLEIPKRKRLFSHKKIQRDRDQEKKIVQEQLANHNAICINCDEFAPVHLLHDFSYLKVIQCHKLSKYIKISSNEKEFEDCIDEVPEIIRKIYPNLSYLKFITMAKDLSWLQETVKLCEGCYLKLTGM